MGSGWCWTATPAGWTVAGCCWGSPLRLFRLSPDGQRLLDQLIAGATVEAASLAVGAAGGRLARTLVDAGILHPRPRPGSTRAQ